MPFDGHEFPQIIPIPPYSAPGEPAPWSKKPAATLRNITLSGVEESLRLTGRHFDVAEPPDTAAELLDVVADADVRPITKKSAVLLALYEKEGESRLILTRRSFELSNHRGEVALPGGRSDVDESASETALREAFEEVGLQSDRVRIVGWLSPIVAFVSGSSIQPIIGFLNEEPTLRANDAEVERIFDVALCDLLEEGNFAEERWRRDSPRKTSADGTFPIYFYRVPGEVVWGATARILTELLCVVTGSAWSGSMPLLER
jgi:8-oxo-dGTP pyrophosphatase MutT (NUDIX family)